MTSGEGPQLDAFAVDVRDLLDRNVANLYSHLITRPTGRAVRMAIESQLGELSPPALSLVDLSSVAILDYSCADEVVAKLLLSQRCGTPGTRKVYIIFQGVRGHHLDPIREVLARYDLSAVVGSGESESFELVGTSSPGEEESWRRIESVRWIPESRIGEIFSSPSQRRTLEGLADRGLVFRHPFRGDIHALSSLIREPR